MIKYVFTSSDFRLPIEFHPRRNPGVRRSNYLLGTPAMKWTNEVICPSCKGHVAARISRDGFLQQSVLSLVGIYPWKCGACGSIFLYRRRSAGGRSTEPIHESGSMAQK